MRSTADMMTEQERQDLRDAGRGHLIDGAQPLIDKADQHRKQEREEGDGGSGGISGDGGTVL